MNELSLRDRRLMNRYMVELLVALGLFFFALVIAHRFGWPLRPGPAKTALTLCPILPFLFMIAVLCRTYQRADEYWRQQMLQNWSIAAMLTGVWTFSYGFLENLGFPRLSMFNVWPDMAALYAGVILVRTFLRR